MRIIKTLLLGLIALTALSVVAFYAYIESLPTSPPDFVTFNELNDQQATAFTCSNNKPFNYGYRVEVEIDSQLNQKTIYHSSLRFNTQLSQANDEVIKGVASEITVDEGQGVKSLDDVYYLSRVKATPYALFTAFNDLGLAPNHPMKIIGQLLKSLSIGQEQEAYHFAYDSIQRTYRYQHTGQNIERAGYPTTANTHTLATLFQEYRNDWQATLGADCVPDVVNSSERQGIVAAGQGGFIKFTIKAHKMPAYRDLSKLTLTNFQNINNQWHVKHIHNSAFADAVTSQQHMWDIFNNFTKDKNTARLVKAAEYLIDQVAVDELALALEDDQVSDESKRELAFALSISNHDQAENYLIDTLSALPKTSDDDIELQKVRLMVALSGNGKISEQTALRLQALANDPSESANVRNNALINAASSVTQLAQQGQGDSLSQGLAGQLSDDLQQANASSAIMAAGNAHLDQLTPLIINKLSSGSGKERYAAASVLSQNPEHTDLLIEHMQREPSLLVNQAILGNLQKDQLNTQQINALEELAQGHDEDLNQLITALLR